MSSFPVRCRLFLSLEILHLSQNIEKANKIVVFVRGI